MVEAIKLGGWLGMILSFMIGPVFFILLETSIKEGYTKALSFSLGVIFSDLLFLVLAMIAAAPLRGLAQREFELDIIGGLVFLVMGLSRALKKPKGMMHQETKVRTNIHHLGKGFMLNILNPLVFFFWLTTTTLIYTRVDSDKGNLPLLACYTMAFLIFGFVDQGKILLARRIKHHITTKSLRIANIGIGIGFIVLAIVLIYRAIQLK